MYSGKFFGTIICTIVVLITSSVIAADRNDPAAYRLVIGNSDEIVPPPTPEKMEVVPTPFEDKSYRGEGAEEGYQPKVYHPESSNGEAFDKHGYIEQNCFEEGCCDSGCCPQWTVAADVMIMDRIGTKSRTLAYSTQRDTQLPTYTDVLNSNDFRQGFASGPRLSLIRHGDCCYDLELLYFQIDGWSSSRTVTATDGNILVFSIPGPLYFRTIDPVRFDYSSRLYNSELNLRWNPTCRITMLAGFRWAELRENLDGESGLSTLLPFGNTKTQNDLYGFQIGTDAVLWQSCRFSIDGLVKAGIYGNHAKQTSSITSGSDVTWGRASTNHTAFLGELGLQAKYQVTKCLSARAGYQLMWIEGVALAPGQIDKSNFDTNQFGIDTSGGVFYHGATAGFEYSF